MKTFSLKHMLVALTVLVMGSATAGWDKETLLSWMPKANDLTLLPRCSKQQRSMDFVRNTLLCSAVANGVISKNNNLTRVALGFAGSLIGSLALNSAYEYDVYEAKKKQDPNQSGSSSENPAKDENLAKMNKMQALIVWTLYFAGQNVPQIIDFAKDSTYRKNIIKAIWDTMFANRDRSEWAAIFVRNFGPLFMHYTPTGQKLSNALPELPAIDAETDAASCAA